MLNFGKVNELITSLNQNKMSNKTIQCNGCGDKHRLTNEVQELLDEGYSSGEPYFCEHCLMQSSHIHYDEFSDADPGL